MTKTLRATVTSSRKRKERPTVEHLTPDRILDIAYSFYVVMSNHHSENSPDIDLAYYIVEEFNRLRQSLSPNSAEGRFVFTVSQIIVSLSRGIARCKANKVARLRAAEDAMAERMKLVSSSTRRAGFIRAASRALITGGVGYTVMEAAMPHLRVSGNSDPSLISFAVALVLILVSSYCNAWWANVKVMRIFMYHHFAVSFADKEYDAAALEEYERAEQSSRRAWQHYAGKPAEAWPNYGMQIREERRLRDEFEERYLRMTADPVTVAVDLLGQPYRAVKKWRQQKNQRVVNSQ